MRPVACSIWQASSEKTFKNSVYFVTDGSFTADGGLLLPAGVCEDNTSNDPFSRCKCAVNGYNKDLTITAYSLTTNTKVNYKIQKERTLSTLRTVSPW